MILDGWGNSTDSSVSAIDKAKTPFIDSLYENYESNVLRTDGKHVGLPEGQMGNSEVGHMNLGAGRIVYQDLAKISRAIKDGELENQIVLTNSIKYAIKEDKKIGNDINNFDKVIRMNRFETDGFEEYLGSKTDIWCINRKILLQKTNTYYGFYNKRWKSYKPS